MRAAVPCPAGATTAAAVVVVVRRRAPRRRRRRRGAWGAVCVSRGGKRWKG